MHLRVLTVAPLCSNVYNAGLQQVGLAVHDFCFSLFFLEKEEGREEQFLFSSTLPRQKAEHQILRASRSSRSRLNQAFVTCEYRKLVIANGYCLESLQHLQVRILIIHFRRGVTHLCVWFQTGGLSLQIRGKAARVCLDFVSCHVPLLQVLKAWKP